MTTPGWNLLAMASLKGDVDVPEMPFAVVLECPGHGDPCDGFCDADLGNLAADFNLKHCVLLFYGCRRLTGRQWRRSRLSTQNLSRDESEGEEILG